MAHSVNDRKMEEKVEKAYRDLKNEMGDAVGETVTALDGMCTFFVKSAQIVRALKFLKEHADGAFDMLTDLTAVDWLRHPEKGYRYEVVYHLCSTTNNHRMRIKVQVSEDEMSAPSVTGVYLGANWMEREVFDMFGLTFDGHPDLRRILLWEGFEGHPLRKDFPTRGLHPIERTPHS